MIIGYDVDDVLLEFMEGMNAFHNRTYHTIFTVDNYVVWDLDKTWGCSPAQAVERVFEFYRSPEFRIIDPRPGAVDAVQRLKHGNEQKVLTARPEWVEKATRSNLDMYFPECFNGVYMLNHFSKEAIPKDVIAEELGIEVMLEDNMKNAIACLKVCKAVVLFNRPWNVLLPDPDGIIRVDNWAEAYRAVRRVEKSAPLF